MSSFYDRVPPVRIGGRRLVGRVAFYAMLMASALVGAFAGVLVVVVTADRGLAGAFNTNVIKSSGQFITENPGREVALGLVGRRGRDFFMRRGFDVRYERVNLFARVKYEDAKAIAKAGMEAFLNHEVDSVYLVYNEFKSVMVQRVVVERLLPIPRLEIEAADSTMAVNSKGPCAVTK